MKRKLLFLALAGTILLCSIGCTTPPATDGMETLPTPPTPPIFWDFWMNFHPNGGESKDGYIYTEHLHPGNPFPYEIPTPEKIGYSKEGYTFKHWNTKADGTGKAYEAGQIINSSNSLWNLYAIWEKNR